VLSYAVIKGKSQGIWLDSEEKLDARREAAGILGCDEDQIEVYAN
jgi:hypothetical protein